MAVALSLLIILPALAENSIKTDGQLIKGEAAGDRVAVGVFSDALDAQYDWQAFETGDDALVFDREDKTSADGNTALTARFQAGAIAYLLDNVTTDATGGTLGGGITTHPADPRNTFFGGTLYVSNSSDAYNTVLINAQRSVGQRRRLRLTQTRIPRPLIRPAVCYCVTATVTNERTNARLTVPLVNALDGTVPDGDGSGTERDALADNYGKFQNFFEVVLDAADTDDRTDMTCNDFAVADEVDDHDFGSVKRAVMDVPRSQAIAARSGDTLTILVKGDTNLISMVVDGDGPEISSVAPAHGTIQDSEVLRISFTASDELSGLRHDAEQVLSEGPNYPNGDSDPTVSNLDKDNFESGEPISDIDGRSTDINVWYGTTVGKPEVAAITDANNIETTLAVPAVPGVVTSNFVDKEQGGATDISIGATDKWTAQEVGKEYDFRLTYVAQAGTGTTTDVFWLVEARDRAGNITRSDAVSGDDAAGDTPYRITIDQDAPELQADTAETGITYKAGTGGKPGKEVTDREYLVFQFTPDATEPGVIGDELDPDSIDIGDFYVEGFSILSYIHPTDTVGVEFDSTDADPEMFDPRSRVYVKLDRPLGSGERPEVQLRHGAVRDLAGNPNVGTAPTKAIDRIGPLLTVTVNGAVQDRPVIMADGGELDIDVSADESLRGRPEIWFAKIKYVEIKDDAATTDKDESDAYYEVDADLKQGAALSRAAGDEMAWSKTYDAGDLGISDTDSGHYAVIVTAVDGASDNNPGYTDGWTWGGGRVGATPRTAPSVVAGDKLDIDDLDDADLIFEADKELPEAQLSVSPANVDEVNETESRFPFIHIEFNDITEGEGDAKKDVGENKEYNDVGSLKDSHSRVVLRSLTVNGTDMLASVLGVQGDEGQFSLAMSQQELGDYEVKYEAVDDAGNEVDGKHTFSVVPRAPYEVDLVPGWNLVSLPGTPLDQSIDSVMVATSAVAVLGYRNGNWETAIRSKVDGTWSPWQGALTSMEGGYGYWIQTDGFESIETLIPEVDPASTLPTVPVGAGWNLLGVIDVRQAAAGKSPLEKSEADDYFTSIPWRVAYSFETIENAWTKLIPETGIVADDLTAAQKADEITAVADEIVNGKGYWVWSSEPGTLVP